jgi:hypothetical protein
VADSRSPRDRVQAAEIRAWARDNGWPALPARGKLPAATRQAFLAARGHNSVPGGGDDDDDDDGYSGVAESDFDDQDDDEAGELLDDEDLEDAAEAQPPPADLDEARARAGRQPASAHLIRGRGRGKTARDAKPKEPPPKVTTAQRRDIEGKVAFWLLIPAEPWRRVDPYCGQAYADAISDIAVKATPLLCQSPAIVRWFAKSTTFIQVTELAMACRPAAEAIIAHHVTKRIQLDGEGEIIRDKDTGQPVPAGGMDFSAYSARQPNPAAA